MGNDPQGVEGCRWGGRREASASSPPCRLRWCGRDGRGEASASSPPCRKPPSLGSHVKVLHPSTWDLDLFPTYYHPFVLLLVKGPRDHTCSALCFLLLILLPSL